MKHAWRFHLAKRVGFLLLGTAMFVGSHGLVMWGLSSLLTAFETGRLGSTLVNSIPTIHRAMCLRMPIGWVIYNPTMCWARILGNPLYALIFILIPIAFLFGPLFCGWLCPAGLTEHLSRLLPSKLKFDLTGKVDPAPLRYGFLIGFILVSAPIFRRTVIGSVCCSYCNWTWTEHVWEAAFGDFHGFVGMTSAGLITFLLWFLILGIFMKGGRGWCIFLCPAGALMNLAHYLGIHLPFTKRLKVDVEKCTGCGRCVRICPTLALTLTSHSKKTLNINYHVCNLCLDCVAACPVKALSYGGREAA
ncbi:MAG: 4Fe-4S binding protein [Candidatus Hecatellaceae archaeon]